MKKSTPSQIHSYDTLMVSNAGDIKLFSGNKDTVEILISNNRRRLRLLSAHKEFGKYMPVTHLQLHHREDHILREAFAKGRPLRVLGAEEQLRVYKVLFRRLIDTAHLGKEAIFGEERAKQQVSFAIDLFPELAGYNGLWGDAIEFLSKSPLVPSHGDLHGDNIIVDGDEVTIIDLDRYGYRPFFFDSFSIPFLNAHRFSDHRLLKAVGDGRVDRELMELVAGMKTGIESHRHMKLIIAFSYASLELFRWFPRLKQPAVRKRVMTNWSKLLVSYFLPRGSG